MFSLLSLTTLCLCIAHMVNGQIGYNAVSNTLSCSKPGGRYCMHDSLQSSIIVSCASSVTAEIRACSIELSHILPEGYGDFAVCYESSDNAGDAICAFNGIGYLPPKVGNTIDIPETVICDDSVVAEVLQVEKRDTINQPCFYPWGKTLHDPIIHDSDPVSSSSPLGSDPSSVTTAPLRPDKTGSLNVHAFAETGAEADARITSVIPTMTVTVQSMVTSVDRTTTAVTSQIHETGGG